MFLTYMQKLVPTQTLSPSFDETAYTFSCSENWEDSLEILLDFVQKPYFTEQSVAKEQGIIGQEIKMCGRFS